jgi:hypothetical protein
MPEVDKKSSTIGNAELAQRFVQFVMMQTQNIFYVLGRIPSPDGRPIPPNLEAAKLLIDQLEMIQEKTRGNLSDLSGFPLDDDEPAPTPEKKAAPSSSAAPATPAPEPENKKKFTKSYG